MFKECQQCATFPIQTTYVLVPPSSKTLLQIHLQILQKAFNIEEDWHSELCNARNKWSENRLVGLKNTHLQTLETAAFTCMSINIYIQVYMHIHVQISLCTCNLLLCSCKAPKPAIKISLLTFYKAACM